MSNNDNGSINLPNRVIALKEYSKLELIDDRSDNIEFNYVFNKDTNFQGFTFNDMERKFKLC